jgi:hypothetical protein
MRINKKAAAVAVAAVALTGTGVAYAYWTTTGTANGTVSSQSGLADFTVGQDTVSGTPMFPGASQALTGTVKNADTTAPAQLQQIKVTLKDPSNTLSLPGKPACTAADYILVGGTGWTVAVDKLSATYKPAVELGKAGSTTPSDTYSFSGISVKMLDNSDTVAGDGLGNQDNCKGATVNLTYDAS